MKKKDPKYLGIPNIQFSLTDKDDKREKLFSKQRIERGFDDSETWSLRDTISEFIIPRLEAFRDMKACHPAEIRPEEWDIILSKMILSFNLVKKQDTSFITEEETEQYKEGMNLFSEYFMDLWW